MKSGPGKREWVLWLLGAILAWQFYFVRELLAILVLAAGVFLAGSVLVGLVLLLRAVGARGAAVCEALLKPPIFVRLCFDRVLELSRRRPRRPHSQPAP